jgi:hypothetical protein
VIDMRGIWARGPRALLVLCGVGLFAAAPTPSAAEEGRCLIIVDGRTYLKGTCNIRISPGGSFTVGVDDERRSEHFAYVSLDGAGIARGSWNGVDAESHAHDELGTLVRKGACWQNARARICAWRRERR